MQAEGTVRRGLKRSSEVIEDDDSENKGKKSRESRLFVNQEAFDDQIEVAFSKGIKEVKIGIKGKESKELKTNNVELRRIFKNLLKSEDELFLTRDKKVIVKVRSAESAKKINQLSKINNEEVEKTFYENTFTTNYVVKGVDPELGVNEIVRWLETQEIKIHKVIRFNRKGSEELTSTILIKELGAFKRKEVKIDFNVYEVTEFIEKPKICYKCLGFGHFLASCKEKESKCIRCGERHELIECKEEKQFCFRCGDPNHSAFDFKCPIIKKESQILRKEIKKRTKETIVNTVNGNRSYAEVTRTKDQVRIKGNISYADVTEDNGRKEENSLTNTIKDLKEEVTNLTKEISDLKLEIKYLKDPISQKEKLKESSDQVSRNEIVDVENLIRKVSQEIAKGKEEESSKETNKLIKIFQTHFDHMIKRTGNIFLDYYKRLDTICASLNEEDDESESDGGMDEDKTLQEQ